MTLYKDMEAISKYNICSKSILLDIGANILWNMDTLKNHINNYTIFTQTREIPQKNKIF